MGDSQWTDKETDKGGMNVIEEYLALKVRHCLGRPRRRLVPFVLPLALNLPLLSTFYGASICKSTTFIHLHVAPPICKPDSHCTLHAAPHTCKPATFFHSTFTFQAESAVQLKRTESMDSIQLDGGGGGGGGGSRFGFGGWGGDPANLVPAAGRFVPSFKNDPHRTFLILLVSLALKRAASFLNFEYRSKTNRAASTCIHLLRQSITLALLLFPPHTCTAEQP